MSGRGSFSQRLAALADLADRSQEALGSLGAVCDLARRISALIHELQRERGLSSGLVAGAGNRFVQGLIPQRERTDEAWAGLRLTLPTSASLADELDQLGPLRDEVSRMVLPPNSVVQRFSLMIDRLLEGLAEVTEVAHPHLQVHLVGLFHFMLAKEHTGQLRALGAAVCAQGGFEPSQRFRFQSLADQRQACLSSFLRHMDRRFANLWVELQSSESLTRWTELQGELAEWDEARTRGPSADDWYQWSTAAIDTMRSLEVALLDDLEDRGRHPGPMPGPLEPRDGAIQAREILSWAVVEAQLLAKRARILSVDLNIEAIRRVEVQASAQGLADEMHRLVVKLQARLKSFEDVTSS